MKQFLKNLCIAPSQVERHNLEDEQDVNRDQIKNRFNPDFESEYYPKGQYVEPTPSFIERSIRAFGADWEAYSIMAGSVFVIIVWALA